MLWIRQVVYRKMSTSFIGAADFKHIICKSWEFSVLRVEPVDFLMHLFGVHDIDG
jgi:hypothetical protein